MQLGGLEGGGISSPAADFPLSNVGGFKFQNQEQTDPNRLAISMTECGKDMVSGQHTIASCQSADLATSYEGHGLSGGAVNDHPLTGSRKSLQTKEWVLKCFAPNISREGPKANSNIPKGSGVEFTKVDGLAENLNNQEGLYAKFPKAGGADCDLKNREGPPMIPSEAGGFSYNLGHPKGLYTTFGERQVNFGSVLGLQEGKSEGMSSPPKNSEDLGVPGMKMDIGLPRTLDGVDAVEEVMSLVLASAVVAVPSVLLLSLGVSRIRASSTDHPSVIAIPQSPSAAIEISSDLLPHWECFSPENSRWGVPSVREV